jgi:hypothetical protein
MQKETFSQETSAVASYKAASHEKSYKTSYEVAYQNTCEASYQAAHDSFARSLWSSLSKIPTFWTNRNFDAQYKCCTGLTFGFQFHQNKCYIEISLAHLTKEKIVKLLREGNLHHELLTLFELAHLPFAEYCLMNIDGLGFDIIDYVKIRLDLVINPKDPVQYGKHWKFMLSRDQLFGVLNRNAADFLEGLQSLRRE